jgi:hypothetical protein
MSRPEPGVQSLGLSKAYSSPRQPEPVVKTLATTTTTITPISQKVVTTLVVPAMTVTKCLCDNMPLSLPLTHNMSSGNKLQQFAERNGITVPRTLSLDYNAVNEVWQANLHYQGLSAFGGTIEQWTVVIEFQCTDVLGGVVIGRKVWRFALRAVQRNLTLGQVLDTRLVVAFLPDPICSRGKEFKFTLYFNTHTGVATIDPPSTIYDVVFYDALGLFKSTQWAASPTFFVDMTQAGAPLPVPRQPLFLGGP